jgi:hypothetical protein
MNKGVSGTATRCNTDHESPDSLEISEDFASAAVNWIRQGKEQSRNHTSSDASEASDKSLMSASEVATVNTVEASPKQSSSVATATEELTTGAIASAYSKDIFSESLSDNYKHTTSEKDETMIVVLEDREADSLDKSDAMCVSSVQSRGQLWSSEKTDDIDHHTSYGEGYPIAVESKTSGDNGKCTEIGLL